MSREQYERGAILQHLRSNRGLELPMTFFELLRGVQLSGPLNLSPHELRENLEYLGEKGYVDLKRRLDMPGFRVSALQGDERPDHIVTVKLTPRAIDLIEGNIPEEPGVVV